MKFRAHFYQLNDDFSQEYADTHNGGKDSELNRRYDWEDELALTNEVTRVDVQEDGTFLLEGQFADGTSFAEEIPHMLVFDVLGLDHSVTRMGCSSSMLSYHELVTTEEEMVLKVFLKDYEPFSNPIPGIYIASQDFPKALITE